MDSLDYAVTIERLSEEDGGGYIAHVPLLPGCVSDGETDIEALTNIHGAIQEWIARARAMGRPVPAPERRRHYA